MAYIDYGTCVRDIFYCINDVYLKGKNYRKM